ncbi:MAG: monofunctional biosynthetic peptidoglycan transglycosylase [Bacteroidota bacterium]
MKLPQQYYFRDIWIRGKDKTNDCIRFVKEQVPAVWLWIRNNPLKSVGGLLGIYLSFQYLTLPNNSLHYYRKHNPQRTALMEQRIAEAENLGTSFSVNQRWIPLSKISQHLVHAVIVAEDGAFYEHEGIDWFEIEESIKKNLEKGKAARGGSTITQQLSKNLFLSTSKSPVRKFKELIITLRMERTLSKRRILEMYLNVIEWGNGIFGAEAAARVYFKKSASQLSREESARMAAVIPNPRKYQPNGSSRYVMRRSELILSRMSARGY